MDSVTAYLQRMYGPFMATKPEAAPILRDLFFLTAGGPPEHSAGGAAEAMAAMDAACVRRDYAEALAQLRVWAGLLGLG